MSPRKKQPLGKSFLEDMIIGLLDEAGKHPDSGLGRFVGWIFKAALLTIFVIVLIFVIVAAFTLYSMLNSG